MLLLAVFFFGVGVCGLLAATLLFPLLASVVYHFRKKDLADSEKLNVPKHIAVVLPVHNEENVIVKTLTSIKKAIDGAKLYYPDTDFVIRLAADNCTDNTVKLAEEQGAQVYEVTGKHGKWYGLKLLISQSSDMDWLILADAGITWSEDFFLKLIPYICKENIVGVLPAYRNGRTGRLEMVSWQLERYLKGIENGAGGPITSHGATAAYRREELQTAFENLGDGDWLNDDIVIPLTIRLQNQLFRLYYAQDIVVSDDSERPTIKREFARRIRMVQGNVEWIRHFCGYALRRDASVAILTWRRISRLLWAYWLLSLAIAVFCLAVSFNCLNLFLILIAVAVVIALVKLKSCRGIMEAAVASLMVPYYCVHQGGREW